MKMHNHQLYKKKLREKAEELINKNPAAIQELQPDDAKKLIEDLQIHQVELEMQNEELRRTQVELAESQEKYSDLFDFAPIGYFILDESTRIQEVNLTGADLLGFRRSELLNLRFSNFISPESQDDFYLHQKRLIETATRQLCELKLIKKDRASLYAKLVSVVVKDRSNNLQNFRTAVADITEEMRARKLQRENEQKFRMLFNQMVSGAALFEVIHDEFGQPADYRFIEINPVFENITGKNRNQVIGNTLLEVFPETEQYWFQEFEKVALTGYSNQIENYHQGLDKYFFVTMFRPQADQLALTFIDISERVHIEKALQEAHDDLEKRVEERTAELENSYASLSLEIAERRRLSFRFLNAQEDERRRIALALHDELGQDLSVLKLDVDSLKKKLSGNQIALNNNLALVSECLNKTIEKVRRISLELIPSVLVDLGLIPALRWLIQSLAEHANTKVSSNILLSEVPFSTEQQIAIYRVFQEVLTNIRKHSQAGQVSIRIGRDDHEVFFRVEDNGIGFDIERIKSLSTTERGLGLATMEERIKMLDGNFKISSRKGAGTKISFEIPIADSA